MLHSLVLIWLAAICAFVLTAAFDALAALLRISPTVRGVVCLGFWPLWAALAIATAGG